MSLWPPDWVGVCVGGGRRTLFIAMTIHIISNCNSFDHVNDDGLIERLYRMLCVPRPTMYTGYHMLIGLFNTTTLEIIFQLPDLVCYPKYTVLMKANC